jgi:diadenosine tetraphosphate (Ap4A) HIT family hydrolase
MAYCVHEGAGCIFCATRSGSVPGHIINEDVLTIAMLDLAPALNGRTLIIRRINSVDLYSTSAKTAKAIIGTSRIIALKLKSCLSCESLKLLQSNGVAE